MSVDNEPATRVRDPERASKILDAAAELFAAKSFHTVSLAEIGQAAGIVGSGIYRHFSSKYAVLVALLDDAMTRLAADADAILSDGSDSAVTMRRLIDSQIEFCLNRRRHVQLYRNEANALQPEDGRRLRRMQRRYNEDWTTTLLELRPQLSETAARALVYAAIAAIQSSVTYDSGLSTQEQKVILAAVAETCLQTAW
ncbi:TetR/AcrR family transcriptional regulator [Nocardia aurantiaca]|uniref:TetR family transcriptional regulator n=1 Tax=Nocardia aurantiaca TaxID=2675850 RepID=A0A6I3L7N4_9NOCA|nr:TetR/AcrR family transcriptional regulator [Nocardia aurantiaca]MTE16734.1 TetR family transcriptional regulator [Nocardia aurantiaca]